MTFTVSNIVWSSALRIGRQLASQIQVQTQAFYLAASAYLTSDLRDHIHQEVSSTAKGIGGSRHAKYDQRLENSAITTMEMDKESVVTY